MFPIICQIDNPYRTVFVCRIYDVANLMSNQNNILYMIFIVITFVLDHFYPWSRLLRSFL
jgi:hypothetical protein